MKVSKRDFMKRSSILFLQAVIVLIGIGVLAFMLWEPHIEGRNVNATTFEIYFNDPFLAYAYAASIFFFVALHQAFKVLGYVRQNKIFSQVTVRALRIMQYCAMTIIGFVAPAVAYLFIVRPGDDIAGGVFIGALIIFVSSVMVVTAATLKWMVQESVKRQSGE